MNMGISHRVDTIWSPSDAGGEAVVRGKLWPFLARLQNRLHGHLSAFKLLRRKLRGLEKLGRIIPGTTLSAIWYNVAGIPGNAHHDTNSRGIAMQFALESVAGGELLVMDPRTQGRRVIEQHMDAGVCVSGLWSQVCHTNKDITQDEVRVELPPYKGNAHSLPRRRIFTCYFDMAMLARDVNVTKCASYEKDVE